MSYLVYYLLSVTVLCLIKWVEDKWSFHGLAHLSNKRLYIYSLEFLKQAREPRYFNKWPLFPSLCFEYFSLLMIYMYFSYIICNLKKNIFYPTYLCLLIGEISPFVSVVLTDMFRFISTVLPCIFNHSDFSMFYLLFLPYIVYSPLLVLKYILLTLLFDYP